MCIISTTKKPMLSVEGQIEHLLSKGVKFKLIEQDEATEYLRKNNNYFKLRAYRKNFQKHPAGENIGKYVNLDFAHLKDLSIIDMRMRYTFIQMALDIEHFAKVKLLHAVENSSDDGYLIVESYFKYLQTYDLHNGTQFYNHLTNEIHRNRNNPYCGGIIDYYDGGFPIWAFIEIIPLGSFIHFYRFCADYLSDKDLLKDYFLLLDIKELRNACAHSNCLIHDMGAKDLSFRPSLDISRALVGFTKAERRLHLANKRMYQIIALLYSHYHFVTSDGVHSHVKENLIDLTNRINHNIDYYSENQTILASFEFLKKSIDIFFS